MWLYDNKQFFSLPEYRTRKRWCGVVLNIGLLVLATFLTVAGTYGSMYVSLHSLSALLRARTAYASARLTKLERRSQRVHYRRGGGQALFVRRQLGLGLENDVWRALDGASRVWLGRVGAVGPRRGGRRALSPRRRRATFHPQHYL